LFPSLRHRGKTALVLAGGGIMGAAYEIGSLTALDQMFGDDFSVNQFDMFVGTSAGSVIASLMANQIKSADLFRAVDLDEQNVFNWRRRDIYRFEVGQLCSAWWRMTRNLWRIVGSYRQRRSSFSWQDLSYLFQEQFPAGLFSLNPMQDYLRRAFQEAGIADDFSQLERELYIPAYDLDRGERVVFGSEDFRDVHICQAITASSAIPFFFRPHRVGGRYYIDGNTGRISHIDVAIERGAKLIVLVNPRVPMHNDPERSCLPSLSYGHCASIAELGIGVAWEQAQRIENHEKLQMALANYALLHPDVEILIIEPGLDESLLFFQSPMSQAARNHIMHYGYHLTLGHLRAEYGKFAKPFRRFGIDTSDQRLQDMFPEREQPPLPGEET